MYNYPYYLFKRGVLMEEFVQWWSVNGFNIVSIIFSGIISLIISAVYYHKGNRNNLQMTMLFPIVRFLNEQYTRKNYCLLNELSQNYCNRYLSKSERKVLTNLVSAYEEVSTYNTVSVNADIIMSYFEYLLKANKIDPKPVPWVVDGETVSYDYPPDWYLLSSNLENVFKQYEPEIQATECTEAIISILSHYCKEYYTSEKLPYFEDYDLETVLDKSKITQKWNNKFESMEKAKKEFLDLKIIKQLQSK